MNLDNYKLATPPEYDSNDKECDDCEGKGHLDISYCCGGLIDSDHLICHTCRDHSDFEECETCSGKGTISNDLIH